jgi:hypothetical protein
MKFVPTALTQTPFGAAVKAAQRTIMAAAARKVLYATKLGFGFSLVALVWTGPVQPLGRLLEDVRRRMQRGPDEGGIESAELVHRGIDHFLKGTGFGFTVRAILLEAGNDDDLGRTEVAQLVGKSLGHIGDDQVVVEPGHFARQVRPDIQPGIGDDGGASARRRVRPHFLRLLSDGPPRGGRQPEAGAGHRCARCGAGDQEVAAIEATRLPTPGFL